VGARAARARHDWISLWWAQDGWFWSKPILNFWIQSLSMASLGTHYHADQMLLGVRGLPVAHPEWVVRAPNVLMTIVAMYLLYKGVAKVFGRRAGLMGALVLATMPDWFFLAHQTMTDMPFVAAMTGAMGLLLYGLNTDEEARVRLYEVNVGATRLRLSAWHLVFGLILLLAIPQIVYLVSRNVEIVTGGTGSKGFRIHWDEFQSGSAANCGLPGNEACRAMSPAAVPKSAMGHPEGAQALVRLFGGFEPIIQAVFWAGVLGGLLYLNWGERRVRRLIYIGAWLCAAIATMAKGPAGIVLPVLCAFAYIATKKRWSELLRVEFLSGLLIVLCVALPWYVAMYVRHGSPFTDRLIFHDMVNRAIGHVHDTNEGDDTSFRFYIWQLGYALFPWTAIAPLGLTYWLRRGDSAGRGRGDVSIFLTMWFVFAFGLFSFMGTKFHHYIFPAVPPIAMLVGIALDDMLGKKPVELRSLPGYAAALVVGGGLVVYGLSRFFPGSILGVKGGEAGLLAPANPIVAGVLVAAGVACLFAGPLVFGRASTPDEDDAPDDLEIEPAQIKLEPADSPYRGGVKVTGGGDVDGRQTIRHERLMMAGAALAGALLLVLVGRDLSLDQKATGDQTGAIRLLQLFTYNYRRPWPDSLDFTAALTAFSIAGVALALALAVRPIRKHAAAAFVAFAFVWAIWGLDVYMVKTAPHWGQHEVIEAYYKDRTSPDQILVAYQMNWKGENFYTSNRIPAFVSTGSTFTTWLKGQREKGVTVMYFVTEHGRTGGLRSEVQPKSYKEITDRTLCNKFVLVRTEL
jgi:4-amino-4-deoxy-L-arabinose transferase-like glycosyltransferase